MCVCVCVCVWLENTRSRARTSVRAFCVRGCASVYEMHPLLRLELGLAAPLANKAVVVALFKLLILGIAGLQEKWYPQHCGLGFWDVYV